MEERLGGGAGGFRFAIAVAGVSPTEGICISPTGVRVAPSPFPSSFRVVVDAGAAVREIADALLQMIRLEERLEERGGGGAGGGSCFRFAAGAAAVTGGGLV